MAERRERHDEPEWPEYLRDYRPEDGWEHELDWEIARVKWARAHGFKQYRMLPLIQRMVQRPGGSDEA
jgi:hypothetical protein